MKTIQDFIMDALTRSPAKAAPAPVNKAVQIALAKIKQRDTLNKWKSALKTALNKGKYSFSSIQAMTAKFEYAVKQTGNYEKAFVHIIDEFGNSDAQAELVHAKASFLKD